MGKKILLLFSVLTFVGINPIFAQMHETPGLTNPVEFETYFSNYYWSGQVGIRMSETPNLVIGRTGSCFVENVGDTCQAPRSYGSGVTTYTPHNPGIFVGNNLDTLNRVYNSNYASFDGDSSLQMEPFKHFRIMFNYETKTPDSAATVGMDPYTNYQLPYCPPGFTSSIRIGNAGGGTESDALYYNMQVNPSNAIVSIHYACVFEDAYGGHGPKDDPAFIIRVMKQNASGSWEQVSDTMCYLQLSTMCSNAQSIPGQCVDTCCNGWHINSIPSTSGYSYTKALWKEWSKVTISLQDYLYMNVRIEIITGDCAMIQHFGYAYIAGESQPMALTSQGCTEPESTSVDTLVAPEGLNNYIFYKQINVVAGVNDHPSNHTLGMVIIDSTSDYQSISTKDANGNIYEWQRIERSATSSTDNRFALIPEDFMRPDSTYAGSMNFLCKTRPFMDPMKPMTSILITNVQFKKPVIYYDIVEGDTVKLINKSISYTDFFTLNPDETYWVLTDTMGSEIGTFSGDTVVVPANITGAINVELSVQTMRTSIDTIGCGSTAHFTLLIADSTHTSDTTVVGDTSTWFVFAMPADWSTGYVDINGDGGCDSCRYHAGDTVTLTAVPLDGYRFDHWVDNGDSTNPRMIIVEHNDTAYFALFVSLDAIDDVLAAKIRVTAHDGAVVVEGAENHIIYIYDVEGRLMASQRGSRHNVFAVPQTGVYMVKIGHNTSRKVVIMK